tara:strand:+ start:152 stop:1228 length:1077 start_codon:yes stop_codon:yes gene_type:complete
VLDTADVLASAEQWATKSRGGDSASSRHGDSDAHAAGGAEVAKVAAVAAARAAPTTDGTISTFEVRMLFSDFGLFSLPLRLTEAELSACAKVVLPEEAEHLGKLSFAQFCELLTRIATQTFSQPPYGEQLRGTAERFGAFCALLRRQHRLKTAGTGVSPFQGEMPTSGLLAASEIRHFKVDEAWHALRGHAPLLDRVFTHYCLYRSAAEVARPLIDEGAGSTTRLSLESWVLLTQECKLASERLGVQVFLDAVDDTVAPRADDCSPSASDSDSEVEGYGLHPRATEGGEEGQPARKGLWRVLKKSIARRESGRSSTSLRELRAAMRSGELVDDLKRLEPLLYPINAAPCSPLATRLFR